MPGHGTVADGAWKTWHEDSAPIRLGVSACLLGERVRYDGGHKRDAFLVDELGRWVEWVSVCPEVELGLGVPRPSVRLVEGAGRSGVRMLAPETGQDFSVGMKRFARRRVRELQELELDGYVLKQNSPSCGKTGIPVHGQRLRKNGVGLFAQALLQAWPHLPVEEEGRLADPALRENFVERLFCRNRWRTLVRARRTRGRLVDFWSAHELLVRAHDELGYRRLGRIVGSPKKTGAGELYALFEAEFFRTLSMKATRRKHTNVLRHALGCLKGALDAGERARLLSSIEDYRLGVLPRAAPLARLSTQIRKHALDSLSSQLYFDPHPGERSLLSGIPAQGR